MPLQVIQVKSGLVKDITEYSAGKAGPFWVDGKNVRFRDGFARKIGGWEKEVMNGVNVSGVADYDTEVSLVGIAREMNYWRAFSNGEDFLAIGTHNHLFILENNALYDITPLRATASSLSDPFATENGKSIVTVTDSSHGASQGDWVRISGADLMTGIAANTFNDYYGHEIVSVVNANSYTIDVGTAATSTDTSGGGTVTIKYLIGLAAGLGTQTSAMGLGWGAGGWGDSTWGTPRATSSSDVVLENSQWSLNLWGEDLVATVRGGQIYYWDTSVGVGTRAVLASTLSGAADVPTQNRVTLVSFPDRHLVAGGTNAVGASTHDPMLVRWSDQEDLPDWTPTATNTAGDQRLEVGTKIVTMVPTRGETFISTDEAVYGMSFVGPPFTFSFRLVATNCGVISKNAATNVDSSVFWMGRSSFFVYNGSVNEIACPVKLYVFDRMEKDYTDSIFVANNKAFAEVSWFYVSDDNDDLSGGNPEPDSYVTFNYDENTWSTGVIPRTTWFDAFGFRRVPFAFSPAGLLYNHESGVDDDGSALDAYIESAPIEMTQSGEFLMLVDKIVPDATITGTLDLTLKTKKYPNASTTTSKGPFSISSTSGKVSVRAKGRQMAVRFASDAIGDNWSLGQFRANLRQDGMR